ncbi:MAG: hypothetical protein KDA81_07225 [Planctomycetaceae bacterium]|nr:hypothetical protein [Planctomycetaceae bacterium]
MANEVELTFGDDGRRRLRSDIGGSRLKKNSGRFRRNLDKTLSETIFR